MNRGMNNVWTLVAAAAIVYGGFCVVMGVIPGVAMSHERPTPGLRPLSAQQARGRDIYVSEGCSYCHTQNIRPLAQDKVFGRPSVGGDYVYSTPQLLGTERTGPDLSNIGLRQPSDVWQYIHLWDPRAVVHDSIMPRYTWFFTLKKSAAPGETTVPVPPGYAPAGEVVIATQQAQDLVAYLKSLKQVPLGKGGAAP
ncbi:MAG TPA: cbb3-type cytochrome c oxidase subunit II [Candidatus Baltobacteraceae bacterium]|nr:cbb3-type cytochrome c oxidase subunit II [Candidatus Baltobacteraceae bacterium]